MPHRKGWGIRDTMLYFELQTVLLVELINAAAGIYQLLLACKERMTLGADFNMKIALCGSGGDYVAACTSDGAFFIIRMDLFKNV